MFRDKDSSRKVYILERDSKGNNCDTKSVSQWELLEIKLTKWNRNDGTRLQKLFQARKRS